MEDLIEILEDNNGIVRDWGYNQEKQFCIIVEDLEEVANILKDRKEEFFLLYHDQHTKCDSCHKIVDIDDTELIDGDNVCGDCCFDNNQGFFEDTENEEE